jgi:ABC-type uncharacterized transport system substrate-binding protein
MIRSRSALLLAFTLLIAPAGRAAAQSVVAVLSSSPGPYGSAYDGFVKAFGRKVSVIRMPGRLFVGDGARVVVAFGGEAAAQSYPEGATLIVCLAPGLGPIERRPGSFVFLTMKPAPGTLISELRRLQPGIKRLALLSHARDTEAYITDLVKAGSAAGVVILPVRAAGPDAVPDALRALLAEKPDALWLAPDPSLVTPGSFQTIKQFSWDNHVPFYAATRALAAAGAAGAVSVSPEDAGRQAAELARRSLAGEALPGLVYPLRTSLTFNRASAKMAGVPLGPQTLGKDDEVLP